MIPIKEPHFKRVWQHLTGEMRRAPQVCTERWQGADVSSDPSARTYELSNVVVGVPLMGIESLDHWREDIEPNLPWADDHFLERVGGEPLNPGVQWQNWPWSRSADRFRNESRFNHTYMERLWPKYCRMTEDGSMPVVRPNDLRRYPGVGDCDGHRGVAWEFGDLQDLVEMLAREPSTRQAWIPLFFPEDTGYADGGRKPCTLGYQIMVRRGEAMIYYPLRSCDLIRHFRDDCYLAVRLLLWVIDRCREIAPETWGKIVPGSYTMHCTSLHVFENDRRSL